jgi:hypothetical protein
MKFNEFVLKLDDSSKILDRLLVINDDERYNSIVEKLKDYYSSSYYEVNFSEIYIDNDKYVYRSYKDIEDRILISMYNNTNYNTYYHGIVTVYIDQAFSKNEIKRIISRIYHIKTNNVFILRCSKLTNDTGNCIVIEEDEKDE